MATSICTVCGLRNEETRNTCLRCGDPVGGGPAEAFGIWREGEVVVLQKGSPLPDRCVRCGAPAGPARLRQRYYWHHPGLYVLAFGALLIYAIVAAIVRKSAVLELGLCPDHFARRRRAIRGSWALGVVGVIAVVVAAGADSPGVMGLAVMLVLAALFWGTKGATPLRAAHIDDDFVRLKGAGSGFLRRLPVWGAFR